MSQLTHKQLTGALQYDGETGVFVWKRPQYSKVALTGTRAGTPQSNGYRIISVGGGRYLEHRLAWFYVHGEWPPDVIDHINGDHADNRIANLRLATQSQNNANSRTSRKNTSGHKGVYWFKPRKRWVVRIIKDGKLHTRAGFRNKEDARLAHIELHKSLYGEFSRV